MRRNEIKIIKLILGAQRANEFAHHGWYSQYDLKQANVQLAIKIINNTPHCAISYKVEERPDQHGHPSTIRYFEWKEPSMNGRKIQFSFHNPREKGGSHGVKSISWTGNKGECTILLEKLEKVYFK